MAEEDDMDSVRQRIDELIDLESLGDRLNLGSI